jgi:hypothetical protein
MMRAVAPSRSKAAFVVVPALLLLGCSGSSSNSPRVGDGSTPTTASTPPLDSTPQTFTANLTVGSGPGNITDTSAGLADLASYTATLTISFEGTNASGPSKWSTTAVMMAAKEPAARQLTVTSTGDVPDPTTVFRAELQGATFVKRGDASCVAGVIGANPEAAPLLGPAAGLSPVIGADAAGSETVNGTSADHYTFDERAILEKGRSTSTGEAWVATGGGYVVKYLLRSKAGAELFGDGVQGTITWDYELTGVNQPVAMSLPADCPAGLVDAPQVAGATNVDNQPGVLTYDTTTSPTDVVTFYQTELTKRGWTASDNLLIDDTSATIDFTQGSATLMLSATVDGSTTSVQLFVR